MDDFCGQEYPSKLLQSASIEFGEETTGSPEKAIRRFHEWVFRKKQGMMGGEFYPCLKAHKLISEITRIIFQ